MTTDPAVSDDDTPAASTPPAELPRGWRAVGKGSDVVHTVGDPEDVDAVTFAGDREDDAVTAPSNEDPDLAFSNAGLLGLGVLAGVYLLYTIGWFAGAGRIAPVAPVLLGGDMHFELLKWMAIAAPFIWFVATFVLTRHSRAWKRFAWLIAGALLLVPWPMFADLISGGTQ